MRSVLRLSPLGEQVSILCMDRASRMRTNLGQLPSLGGRLTLSMILTDSLVSSPPWENLKCLEKPDRLQLRLVVVPPT